jgi:hypothetical protein
MSLSPEPSQRLDHTASEAHTEPSARESTRAKIGWQRRLLRISLALFTLEIGLFLVFFPWMESWDHNYFHTISPSLEQLWSQPSFRGALTGLGFVNIYIACLQFLYSFRKS